MKTFEKPLSAKEEKEYLEKYRNGDVRAGDVLIIRNMRLVAHMVRCLFEGMAIVIAKRRKTIEYGIKKCSKSNRFKSIV